MARINIPKESIYTHEGAKAKHINPELQLRRSVMSCMLWEKEFYEDGETIADRINSIIPHVDPIKTKNIAIEARKEMKLRHVPLLIARQMASLNSHRYFVSYLLEEIIQRPDELTEFLAIYWKDKRQPLSAQVKKGLAMAFEKFDEYQLSKYNRDNAIKLRDVMMLVHPRPKDKEQSNLWKKLLEDKLEVPETWEVGLSSGADKKEVWEKLLKENKLGAMALLRNLRNFQRDKVDENLVFQGLERMRVDRILPFRFISAARYAPDWEPEIEKAMMKCLTTQTELPGHTVLLLDVSGSMNDRVSAKSDITRLDAACGVAILAKEICQKISIFTFSEAMVKIPSRHGFALRDAIVNSQDHSGTLLGLSVKSIYSDKPVTVEVIRYGYGRSSFTFQGQDLKPDRLIVITDEQSHDPVPDPQGVGYMINVASYQNGVGYGVWHHINGWSEAVLDYIKEIENDCN